MTRVGLRAGEQVAVALVFVCAFFLPYRIFLFKLAAFGLLVALGAWVLAGGASRWVLRSPQTGFLVALPALFCFSLLLESMTDGRVSMLDLGMVYQFLAPLAAYLAVGCIVAAHDLAGDGYAARHDVIRVVARLGFALALLVIVQFFNLFQTNDLYFHHLHETRGELYAGRLFIRAIGFTGNPNEVGYLLAVGLLACAWMSIYSRATTARDRWMLLVVFVAVLLTKSRTALVIVLVGLAVLWCHYLSAYADGRGRAASVLLVGAVLGLVAWLLAQPGVYEILTSRMFDTHSLEKRIESHWVYNMRLFADNPVLGVGSRLGDSDVPSDNEWLFLLRAWGVVGVSAIVLSMAVPWLLAAATATRRELPFVYFHGVLLVMTALYMLTNAIRFPVHVSLCTLLFGLLPVGLRFAGRSDAREQASRPAPA